MTASFLFDDAPEALEKMGQFLRVPARDGWMRPWSDDENHAPCEAEKLTQAHFDRLSEGWRQRALPDLWARVKNDLPGHSLQATEQQFLLRLLNVLARRIERAENEFQSLAFLNATEGLSGVRAHAHWETMARQEVFYRHWFVRALDLARKAGVGHQTPTFPPYRRSVDVRHTHTDVRGLSHAMLAPQAAYQAVAKGDVPNVYFFDEPGFLERLRQVAVERAEWRVWVQSDVGQRTVCHTRLGHNGSQTVNEGPWPL